MDYQSSAAIIFFYNQHNTLLVNIIHEFSIATSICISLSAAILSLNKLRYLMSQLQYIINQKICI